MHMSYEESYSFVWLLPEERMTNHRINTDRQYNTRVNLNQNEIKKQTSKHQITQADLHRDRSMEKNEKKRERERERERDFDWFKKVGYRICVQ